MPRHSNSFIQFLLTCRLPKRTRSPLPGVFSGNPVKSLNRLNALNCPYLKEMDFIFTMLHVLIISFNLLGWIWKKTRKAHLIVVALTFASWFILGIWYGWGYCFLTDWHWREKERLGETNLPNSFIKYMADKMTGSDIDAGLVDLITIAVFIFIILITIYVNFIHRKSS